MKISRRGVLVSAAALGGCAVPELATSPVSPFVHGVASGDPLRDRVIIWTRVSPPGGGSVRVGWSVASVDGATVAAGETVTGAAQDHTVKVDVTGLAPNARYTYRFYAMGHQSPIGRTRTLPTGAIERVRFAVVSCANYPVGYFNVYAAVAANDEIDAVVHLGDYLYEFGPGQRNAGAALGRVHEPAHEVVRLADYRQRHAQYRSDPDLQAAHARHPFIAVWDDHESANNSWRDGAQNHDLSEGDWSVRKAASIQAYFEWMPIRGAPLRPDTRIFRRFRYGDLVDLLMLDTRLFGRDEQPSSADDLETINDPNRSMLGPIQHRWLADQLATRASTWQLIGQQLMFGQLTYADRRVRNLDQWDAYPASRKQVLDAIARAGGRNVIILTGDLHTSWALEVCADPFTNPDPVAVELITPSVTSNGRATTARDAARREQRLLEGMPHLKFVDLWHRGYLDIAIDADACQARWHFVETIAERNPTTYIAAGYTVGAGSNRLTRS